MPSTRGHSQGDRVVPPLVAGVVAAAAGVSGFWSGAYDVEVWGPAAMLVLAGLLVVVLAYPAIPSRLAAVALSALFLLACWTLVSALWAPSVDRALLEGYRALLYAAALALLTVCASHANPRLRLLPLAAAGAAVSALGAYVVARMLAEDAGDLFVGARLHGPVDYFNAEATLLILGFWIVVGFAHTARRAAAGALGAGIGAVLLSLIVLTQSRGGLIAVGLSALVVVALARTRVRLAWMLLVAIGGAAAALPELLDVIAGPRVPDDGEIADAARAAVAGGALASLLWAVGAGGLAHVRREPARRTIQRLSHALLALAAAALVAGAGVALTRADEFVDEFKSLESPRGEVRLTSAGGSRYEHWRVALVAFRGDPLIGSGAAGYDKAYFQERRTTEDIRQPHSLGFQTLAELGVVGSLLLAGFLVSVLIALGRAARSAESPGQRSLVVAAGGAFVAWVAHSAVDWVHLVPANTIIALVAAATLLGPWVVPLRPAWRSPPQVVGILLVAATASLGIVSIGRATVAEHLADEAQAALAGDPREALEKSADALSLNGRSLRLHYLRAAAFARLRDYAATRATLGRALELSPERFVTWALLGDLAVRRGELSRARRYYRRASRLNPRDPFLMRFATNHRVLRRLNAHPELGQAAVPVSQAGRAPL